MRVSILTDLHFGARESSQIIIDQQKRFFEEIYFPFLDSSGIKTLIILGDTFCKRKHTSSYVLDQAKRIFFDELERRGINTYILVGNHDSAFKNTLEVNTPTLLLKEYSNIQVISSPQIVDIHGINITMIPWICHDNEDLSLEKIKEYGSSILMGHLEIKNFQMYSGVDNQDGIEESLFSGYKTVLSGHYHHRSTRGNITYLGTAFEMTWADYGDPKGFHVFDLSTHRIEFIRNPITLFLRLDYDDRGDPHKEIKDDLRGKYVKLIVTHKKDHILFDQFLLHLQANEVSDIKIIENSVEFGGEIKISDVSIEKTQDLIKTYVDNIDVIVDKDRISNCIISLYTEAVNL